MKNVTYYTFKYLLLLKNFGMSHWSWELVAAL